MTIARDQCRHCGEPAAPDRHISPNGTCEHCARARSAIQTENAIALSKQMNPNRYRQGDTIPPGPPDQ